MSKYLLNKFLYTVDRDPDLVERYREDPRGTVAWWEAERANVILNVPEIERSTWLEFTDTEREALATHDFVQLFELGAHNFLTLTLFIAMFERDYDEPLGFQLEYARQAEPLQPAVPRHFHLRDPAIRLLGLLVPASRLAAFRRLPPRRVVSHLPRRRRSARRNWPGTRTATGSLPRVARGRWPTG